MFPFLKSLALWPLLHWPSWGGVVVRWDVDSSVAKPKRRNRGPVKTHSWNGHSRAAITSCRGLGSVSFLHIFHSLSPAMFHLFKDVHFLCAMHSFQDQKRLPHMDSGYNGPLATQSVGQGPPHLSLCCPYLPAWNVIVGAGVAENPF